MKRAQRGTRLTLALPILTGLLSGCANAPAIVKVECPRLAEPPHSVLDALEASAIAHGDAAAWVIALDRHYRKLDECR